MKKSNSLVTALGAAFLLLIAASPAHAGVVICFDKDYPNDPSHSFTAAIEDSHDGNVASIDSEFVCRLSAASEIAGSDAKQLYDSGNYTSFETLVSETGVSVRDVTTKMEEWGIASIN